MLATSAVASAGDWLRGLEVDDQLELSRLLNWKIRGLHACRAPATEPGLR